jgi:hypothetical protein
MLIMTTALLMGQPPSQWSTSARPATDGVNDKCYMKNTKFLAGEEVVYQIQYKWNLLRLNAGEAVFKIRDTSDMYHVTLHGQTYGAVEWFYNVNDRFESYIDKESLLPEMFIRDVEEGKYRKYNKAIFDQDRGRIISYEGRTKADLKREDFDITHCMHDMLSILYHMRNLNLDGIEAGEAIPVEVFLEKKYPLKVRVVEKNVEKRIKGHGKFNTHIISPEVIAGHVFEETDQMKVYVSTDDNALPLLIETPVSVGRIRAVLKEYKGLRYDLEPMIEE